MKNKNSKHHLSIHQRIERLCHHNAVLSGVVFFLILGLIKYQSHMFGVLQKAYDEGFGITSLYAHHDEVTRMPIQYGSGVRTNHISGE